MSDSAIIIPVHNRRELTMACLSRLRGVTPKFCLVVVDDGSTDGTTDAIRAHFPEVTIVPGSGELYWTGAIRLGMLAARERGAQFLFWCNDDVDARPATFATLRRFLATHPGSIASAACWLPNGDTPIATGFRGRQTATPASQGPLLVDGLSGYCVGFPAEVCDRVGLPLADRMPHYGADAIYTLMATRAGYQVWLLAEPKVTLLDHRELPDLKTRAKQWAGSRKAFVQSVFWQKKSMYYLPGQFWYHQAKYGPVIGLLFYLFKVGRWSAAIWKAGMRPAKPR